MATLARTQTGYPALRPRRLRRSAGVRRMVRETVLTPADFIYPMFVAPGSGLRREIGSMPGIFQLSVDEMLREVEDVVALGIPAVLLFGLPASKDAMGSGAFDPAGPVPQAVRALKQRFPQLVVITDVCLCEYTDHGHCGLIEGDQVVNDPTLDLLARMALTHAAAGADIVAPSDMMDGRVASIRRALDERGFEQIPILSYSAKYASAFYGPFREAAGSAPQFGDRRGYQLDPGNAREAMLEITLDLAEGADMVMVKPALAYLDVLQRARQLVQVPLVAYNVSGEYAMVKAAAQAGWLDERRVTLEILHSIKRAGADLIISYHAPQALRWLQEDTII